MLKYPSYLKTQVFISGLLVFVMLAGCKVGPSYKRPETNTSGTYRFSVNTDTNTIANTEWVALFRDPALQNLVNLGLQNNYDLKIAYERINEARASFRAAKGSLYPQLNVEGNATFYKQVAAGEGHTYTGLAGISWEIDLWGKLRRATEAGKASLMAAQAYQQSVKINLISSIITNYFNLLELDNELKITIDNIRIREESLELVKYKLIAGTTSGLVVSQAEAELANARTQVPELEMQIGEMENALSVLIGSPPKDIGRGNELLTQITLPEIKSTGIPSQLITRRPDIIQAEQELRAANANVGVARAYMLPSLSLTGSAGYSFDPTSMIYNAVGNLVAPVFGGGKLRANYKKAVSQKEQMLLTYQKAILTSLQETSDAILETYKLREIVTNQDSLVSASKTTFELSNQLYNAGYASYMDVLDAQRNLFTAQIGLSRSQASVLTSFVNLYRSLGGGWK